MFVKRIQTKSLCLYYSDTSYLAEKSRYNLLKPWLSASLTALEKWLWGKSQNDFALSKMIKQVEFQLSLCGAARMRTLNREFRGKDKSTDVLSFQMHEDFSYDELAMFGERLNLGDLFICKEKTMAQARAFDLSFEEEFVHLLVHGFVHLCGYDHERGDKEEKEMQILEKRILSLISNSMHKGSSRE